MAAAVRAWFTASALIFVDPAATAFVGTPSGSEQAFVGIANPIPDAVEERGKGRMC